MAYLRYLLLVAISSAPLMAATGERITVATPVISALIDTKSGSLRLGASEDRLTHAKVELGEAFVLVLADGTEIRSSAMKLSGSLKTSPLQPEPRVPRAALQLKGREICADLTDASAGASVHWCMIQRDETNYLRQEITIKASDKPLPLADVQMLRFKDASAKVVGTVAGSPIVSGDFFRGFEHPLSYSSITNGEAVSGLKRTLPLSAGQSITYSSVIGVAHTGQMRRDFLDYVELERAHPYRTFLHYNTWYDLRAGDNFTLETLLDRMNTFGDQLIRKRGATLDSFMMDDGWDNTSSLWGFNDLFPDGFTPLRSTAKQYGFGIGVWLSPWGGYATAKQQRITYGRSQGYEIVDNGYALSGPKYYEKFEQTCLNFIDRYGVNQFKFDGTGNADQVFPGSTFDSDFSAAIHLIERLRQKDAGIFINLTTGTKPSPFWLRYADSIWRSGDDHSFAGEGTWRQKWITYRDGQTYKNIVEGGPLYPLNSLMLHGIIYGQKAKNLMTDPGHDFADEVRSYFGTGTQLQELYLTPSLLSPADWDVLAESARWSRDNASTLRDTHWVGGDPLKNEVYGWASWSKQGGIIVLRNPSSQPGTIDIDVQKAFELPKGAAMQYQARSPWKADAGKPSISLRAATTHRFDLKPFEVITLQAALSR